MEPLARAADRARIQAPLLYRGCGPAVVAGSVQAPHAGTRGDGVSAGCGARVFRRAVAVDLLFPTMLPGASLSQGTVWCPCPGPAARCGG